MQEFPNTGSCITWGIGDNIAACRLHVIDLKNMSEENERLEIESRKFKNQLEHSKSLLDAAFENEAKCKSEAEASKRECLDAGGDWLPHIETVASDDAEASPLDADERELAVPSLLADSLVEDVDRERVSAGLVGRVAQHRLNQRGELLLDLGAAATGHLATRSELRAGSESTRPVAARSGVVGGGPRAPEYAPPTRPFLPPEPQPEARPSSDPS